MSTHKHIDRICVVITVLALLITILFMNGEALGLEAAPRSMGYESTLFDTSRVHTIDIVIDDWDAFLETATGEEYTVCSVVIDNEAVKNVAIRGKGNTSLSTVATMGSSRYSFKLEFDHYEDGKTYKGLDKLCLNNLIQDNTYMKDYLAYRLMDEYGVDTPLCSYVWVTVNGEDWGLYLAVEAVEDSFTSRVYNGEGDLYKPDSLSMGGGGPGNGRDFNIEDFINENAEAMGFPWGDSSEEGNDAAATEAPAESGSEAGSGGSEASSAGGGSEASSAGGGQTPPSGMPSGGSFSGMPGGTEMPSGGMEPPGGMEMPGDFSGFGGGDFGGGPGGDFGGGGFGGFGGFGVGSGDVKLQYSDDDPDSYSNIFDNAKSVVTNSDKSRLIRSLKSLSEGENLEDVLDIDELLRYFVVHNYLVNSDSYTGSMVHNYYLHESDGKLSMIPWDYNLAFGTFQSGDATDAVNDPIDTPLSVSGDGSRPMVDWIFQSEEYTELYHQYFAAFLDEIDIQAMIDETYALIAPYVEKDPTAFCSYEEFEAGVETLKSFCEKRTESIRGQLEGSIPSTDAGQQADSSALIDASELTLSAMGSMGGGGGGFGGGDFGGGGFGGFGGENSPGESGETSESSPGGGDEASSGGGSFGTPPTGGGDEASSGGGEESPAPSEQSEEKDGSRRPGGSDAERSGAPSGFQPGDRSGGSFPGGSSASSISWPLLIVSALVLIAGLLTAILYKRRK